MLSENILELANASVTNLYGEENAFAYQNRLVLELGRSDVLTRIGRNAKVEALHCTTVIAIYDRRGERSVHKMRA